MPEPEMSGTQHQAHRGWHGRITVRCENDQAIIDDADKHVVFSDVLVAQFTAGTPWAKLDAPDATVLGIQLRNLTLTAANRTVRYRGPVLPCGCFSGIRQDAGTP